LNYHYSHYHYHQHHHHHPTNKFYLSTALQHLWILAAFQFLNLNSR
jgi:hypothetical protein